MDATPTLVRNEYGHIQKSFVFRKKHLGTKLEHLGYPNTQIPKCFYYTIKSMSSEDGCIRLTCDGLKYANEHEIIEICLYYSVMSTTLDFAQNNILIERH